MTPSFLGKETSSYPGAQPALIIVCLSHVILLMENPETPNKVRIPGLYADFAEDFSKAKVSKLPPHQPWDCSIAGWQALLPLEGVFTPFLFQNPKP